MVTGASGFIGRKVAASLSAAGHTGICVDLHNSSETVNGFKFLESSFLELDMLLPHLADIDLLIHLASTSIPSKANLNIVKDMEENVTGTINLAVAATKVGVKRFVFMSSGGTVYGDVGNRMLTEEDRNAPLSAYGAAKLSVETYLRVLGVSQGLDFRIIRLANPYGPGQSAKGIQGLIPIFLRKVHLGEQLDVWGDGQTIRDYLYIDDVVDGILRVCFNSNACEIYNLGSGVGRSVLEVIEHVETQVQKKANIKYSPARSFDVKVNVLDYSKIARQTEWQPKTDFSKGVGMTWDSLKDQF